MHGLRLCVEPRHLLPRPPFQGPTFSAPSRSRGRAGSLVTRGAAEGVPASALGPRLVSARHSSLAADGGHAARRGQEGEKTTRGKEKRGAGGAAEGVSAGLRCRGGTTRVQDCPADTEEEST